MLQPKEDDSIEFKWGKKRGVGGMKKDVQFFESFTYDNVEYTLYDSVYMYAEKEPEPYIGKVIKIWENKNETKKVKILWFFRPCEIKNYIEADKILDNELFLASGEGSGLANVNPLEVIAGKCNVVCISKDSRNPQPSNEEIQMADFIFYRTFDVGRCLISDKIDDKIAGVDVKSLLNRVTQKSSIVSMPDSSKKELSGNAVVTDGVVVLFENNTSGEQKTLKTDDNPTDASAKEKEDSKVLLANQKSSLGQKPASSPGIELVEMVKVDHTQGGLSGDKTKSTVKENAESVRLSVKQKSSLVEKPPSNIGDQLGEVKINGPQKNTARDKTNSRSNDKEITDRKPSLVKQKSSLGDTNASNLGVELDEMAKNIRQQCIPNDKITSRSKDDPVRGESKSGKVPATEVQVEEKVQAAKNSGRVDDRPSKKAKPGDFVKASGENNKKIVQISNHDSGGSNAKTVNQNNTASENKITSRSKDDPVRGESKSGKVPATEVQVEEKVQAAKNSGRVDDRLSKKGKSDDFVKASGEKNKKIVQISNHDSGGSDAKTVNQNITASENKITSRSKDDPVRGESKSGKVPATEVQVEEKVQAAKNSGRVDDRPSKKAKPDDFVKASGENNKKIVQISNHDSGGSDAKTVNQNNTASENKSKRKFVKDPHGNDNISSKKPKLVKDPDGTEKLTKLANGKLPKASPREASNDVNKTNNQISEVTRKPEVDKSKWFKEPVVPWEERLQTANAEGKLVLLQNLDPSYTAAEVEDIVRHAFNQNCTAKMIQRTAFSSPHSGRAFVIFKTREATETVLTKLDEDCLLLSNGRPLVGSIATLSFPGKLSTFFGHISIDKLRLHMQREMKEAVSTSHCSQPNTIEYDMAMDWCLLQERTDLEWKLLYKQQGKDLRQLKSTLKSK